jgi:beta-1,4-mannooligosaccharide phosphorylase
VSHQLPHQPWETSSSAIAVRRSRRTKAGSCSPTGWAVRIYSIGAVLLDVDDPTRISGRLVEPLLSPTTDEQDGNVPNVVYSCGALVHADTLVIPYGIADTSVGIAIPSVSRTSWQRSNQTQSDDLQPRRPMPSKSPQKPNPKKKPVKTLKEKRSDKKARKTGRSGLGT